jgi:hypothetical protein
MYAEFMSTSTHFWLDDALCFTFGGNVIVPLPLDFHRDLLAN